MLNISHVEEAFLVMPTCQISDLVTVRDLLSHRVCLVDDAVTLTVGGDEDIRSTYAHRIRYLTKQCDFRAKYKYSNSMYGIAGYVVQSICAASESCSMKFGDTWEDGIAEIFRQTGMTSSVLAAEIVKNREEYENNGKLARSHLK